MIDFQVSQVDISKRSAFFQVLTTELCAGDAKAEGLPLNLALIFESISTGTAAPEVVATSRGALMSRWTEIPHRSWDHKEFPLTRLACVAIPNLTASSTARITDYRDPSLRYLPKIRKREMVL